MSGVFKVTISGEAGKFYAVDIKGTPYWFSGAADGSGAASFIMTGGTTVGIYETSTELTFEGSFVSGWTNRYYEDTVSAGGN